GNLHPVKRYVFQGQGHGDAHVDRTLKTKTPFNDEFQDLITRYAWGEIWTRPGLPRHTRSIATLAMLVALNRPDELKLHLRASANNGVTRDEIKELLMQCAIYCGVPAANAAFHMAKDVFADMDAGG
ncbi:MAG TPA: 4-carboxymuconolactone decarboxylase, partial [Burkholderiales bacterium]